jgi:hypothetical protein
MNKYQTARLDSLNLIVKESRNNPESIARVPIFGIIIDQIATICTNLEADQVEQEKNLTGITTNKDVALDDLTDSTIEIAGAVYSYAHDKQDNALMMKVNYKSTAVEKMTQSEVVAAAGIILEEALKIPAEDLNNEGITPEELSAYSELISFFKNIKSSKREAVIDRSGTTEKINELFKEAITLVKEKLDRLAVQFKRKDPEFYLKYKAARTVQYRSATKKGTEDEKKTPE